MFCWISDLHHVNQSTGLRKMKENVFWAVFVYYTLLPMGYNQNINLSAPRSGYETVQILIKLNEFPYLITCDLLSNFLIGLIVRYIILDDLANSCKAYTDWCIKFPNDYITKLMIETVSYAPHHSSLFQNSETYRKHNQTNIQIQHSKASQINE